MKTATFPKTAVALAVAGTLAGTAMPAAHADVYHLSWKGAFTFLNPYYGSPIRNSPTDYASGYYALPGAASGPATTHGWFGHRTPISGTLSFDTNTGAGVAIMTPFLFLGNATQHYANAIGMTFQTVDTVGTMVGALLFSWNLGSHQVSMVMDASGLLNALPAAPGTDIAGVGALPASNGIDFDGSPFSTLFLPLGPAPMATTTRDALGCEAQLLAAQANAYTINPTGNIANCDLTQDDGIAGSPSTSIPFYDHGFVFDVTSVHVDSVSAVPIPPALWLFGSGLLGLAGLARRKFRKKQ